MKCSDCKFWRKSAGFDPDVGDCHRRAPSPVGEALNIVIGTLRARGVAAISIEPDQQPPPATGGDLWDRRALWPATLQDDFCGEFVERQERQGLV